MITGTVVLSLRADSELADRKSLCEVYSLPDGVRVILEVGDRTFALPYTVDHLQQNANRVDYDVHGSADAVKAWVTALRRPAYDMGCC